MIKVTSGQPAFRYQPAPAILNEVSDKRLFLVGADTPTALPTPGYAPGWSRI